MKDNRFVAAHHALSPVEDIPQEDTLQGGTLLEDSPLEQLHEFQALLLHLLQRSHCVHHVEDTMLHGMIHEVLGGRDLAEDTQSEEEQMHCKSQKTVMACLKTEFFHMDHLKGEGRSELEHLQYYVGVRRVHKVL